MTPPYPTGVYALSDADQSVYKTCPHLLRRSASRRIEGFTDRQGAQARNVLLGEARARR